MKSDEQKSNSVGAGAGPIPPNHLSLPWRTHLVDSTTVIDANGNEIATMHGDYETEYVAMEARAEFIVRAANNNSVTSPSPAPVAEFVKEQYGAVVATILEDEDSIVEVQERNDGVYGLIVHHRRHDRDQWDDLTAYLKPEHFDLLGSIAKRMREPKAEA